MARLLRLPSLLLLLAGLCLPVNAPAAPAERAPDPLPADSLIQLGKQHLDRGMQEGSSDALRTAQSLFERAAKRDTLAGLSHYYAGLAFYRLIDYSDEDGKALDAAIDHLKTATEMRPEWPEGYALLAAAYGRKAAGGMLAGMRYGPKSDDALERARELDPENPRVVLVDAIGLYQKPSIFGGDTEKAVQKMKHAARLFADRPAPSDPLAPSWGHAMTYAWMGIAHLEADRLDQAQDAFDQALALRPNLHWVQDVLLPKLNAAKG